MTKLVKNMVLLLFICCLVTACSTVPITGRKQISLIPDSQLLAMSYSQYDQFMSENKKSTNAKATAQVKRVGDRIQKAVTKYLKENNMGDRVDDYQWEFNLIASDQVNAWAMPGGKVVIYEGILPVTQDDTGLAVVMGHEIAHIIAGHGDERMSQGLMAQLGGAALSVALSSKPAETQALWMGAYGVGAQVGAILPFSRLQEKEADRLGMIFMALAGYQPKETVDFWERMSAQKEHGGPPEFLSTHPSSATRIAEMKKNMPEAMRYFSPS